MSRERHLPNEALTQALSSVAWTPYDLAKKINQELGAGFVHRTTPYLWCKHGGTPRSPLPDVVARLLSRAGGRLIRPSELWPGLVDDSRLIAADDGLGGTDPDGWLGNLSVVLDADTGSAGLMCVSGTDLLAFIRAWEPSPRARQAAEQVARGPGLDDDPILDHLTADLARLRAIDDDTGGHMLLAVVAHQQRLLAQFALHHGGSSVRAYEYLALLAQYCQFAGWLAMDLGASTGSAPLSAGAALGSAGGGSRPRLGVHLVSGRAGPEPRCVERCRHLDQIRL
jgi:hypothetical protein